MSDLLEQAAAQEQSACSAGAVSHAIEATRAWTRQEAMEELTSMLNAARSTRKFAYQQWGEKSAHAVWDREISLFEFLLAELGRTSDGAQTQA